MKRDLHDIAFVARNVNELVDAFLHTAIDGERKLVAAGWWNPAALLDVASEHNLFGEDFTDKRCGYLFDYLCVATRQGRAPTIDEALRVAYDQPDVDLDHLDYTWVETILLDDIKGHTLAEYAAQVVHMIHAREHEARDALQAFSRTFIPEDGFEVIVIRRCQP